LICFSYHKLCMSQAVPLNRGGGPASMQSTRDTLSNLDGFEDGNSAMDMDGQIGRLQQMQQPQMFPVLMPQNIQGQVMAPLMQVPMPYNGQDQTCFAWMAPMQGVQGVQNVQMQFTPQISGQSQFSQDSLDQGDRLAAFMDQGPPQQQAQLQQLLLMTPTQAQQAQQPLQQMPVDPADEVIQMHRQRQQQMLQQGQNLPRQQQNGRQQQQQQAVPMMRQQQMMQAQLPQGLPQQPPQSLDGQPPGTWHRDPEQWLRPPRRMGGNNWEESQQDWQQLGNPMPGQGAPVAFGMEVPQAWAYGGNEASMSPPPYPASPEDLKPMERVPATKMNWAELSENSGEHLMPGPLDFRANNQRGPSKSDGPSRGMGMQKFSGSTAGAMRNQAMQQLGPQMHRSGGTDRRGMERGMPDGNKKPSGRGGGRQNFGGMDGMPFPGAELMAGTGEAPTYGQPRDLWDGAGPMLNRGRPGPGDSGIPGGRNVGDRRRGPWGGETQGADAGRNGNMPGASMGAGNGQGRPAPWNPAAADTMKAQLQALQLEDPATVFIARRINKLGFTSAEQLEAHFSKYGEVKGVYVSHSRVKSLRTPGDRNMHDAHWRLRAAALGFVVMKLPEATAKILSEGSEHNVNGVTVRLQSFHRRNCADAAPGEDRSAPQEEAPPQEFPRWPSPGSDDDRTPVSPVRPQLPPSPNKLPINDQIPKAMEDPDMSDAAQLYYNYVISGGPIIYTSGQEDDMHLSFEDKIKKAAVGGVASRVPTLDELTNAMPECYSD